MHSIKTHSHLRTDLSYRPRSYLFVPATRTDRIIKALASDADCVIIDLEDAVNDADKSPARANLLTFFTSLDSNSDLNLNLDLKNKPIWIRINNIDGLDHDGSEDFYQDIELCKKLSLPSQSSANEKDRLYVSGIVLPKVENGETIEHVYNATNLPIILQIETATAIHNIKAITSKAYVKGIYAISYGKLDLCNELGMRLGSQAQIDFINHLRYQMLLLSKANGLQAPIESIYPDFNDVTGLDNTAEYVADLGFSGMLAIHPKQIEAIHQAFIPSEAEIDFAKKVIAHFQDTNEAVFDIDGIMIDLPAIKQCERLLGRLE